jgi:hypothetical protein
MAPQRLFKVVNATVHAVAGRTVIDGHEAAFTQPALTVELEPADSFDGTVKLCFRGKDDIEAGLKLYVPGTVLALGAFAPAAVADVLASRFAPKAPLPKGSAPKEGA